MLALQSGVNTSSKIRDLTRWGQTPPHVSASGIGICVTKHTLTLWESAQVSVSFVFWPEATQHQRT